MKLGLWVNAKSSKVVVTFTKVGKVTLVIFLSLDNLKFPDCVFLLTLSKSWLIFFNFGEVMHPLTWENKVTLFLWLVISFGLVERK